MSVLLICEILPGFDPPDPPPSLPLPPPFFSSDTLCLLAFSPRPCQCYWSVRSCPDLIPPTPLPPFLFHLLSSPLTLFAYLHFPQAMSVIDLWDLARIWPPRPPSLPSSSTSFLLLWHSLLTCIFPQAMSVLLICEILPRFDPPDPPPSLPLPPPFFSSDTLCLLAFPPGHVSVIDLWDLARIWSPRPPSLPSSSTSFLLLWHSLLPRISPPGNASVIEADGYPQPKCSCAGFSSVDAGSDLWDLASSGYSWELKLLGAPRANFVERAGFWATRRFQCLLGKFRRTTHRALPYFDPNTRYHITWPILWIHGKPFNIVGTHKIPRSSKE